MSFYKDTLSFLRFYFFQIYTISFFCYIQCIKGFIVTNPVFLHIFFQKHKLCLFCLKQHNPLRKFRTYFFSSIHSHFYILPYPAPPVSSIFVFLFTVKSFAVLFFILQVYYLFLSCYYILQYYFIFANIYFYNVKIYPVHR